MKKCFVARVCAHKRGFTLSELLMSVLVVSIILVAMAPVITKRTSDNISVTGVKTEGILFTPNTMGGTGCTITKANAGINANSTNCTFTVPKGVYKINAILVGAGGRGGDSDIMFTEHVVKTITADMMNSKGYYDIETPDNTIIDNFKILYAVAQGGDGAPAVAEGYNGTVTKPLCDSVNAIYFKDTCITKANVGDPEYGGAPAASSVNVVSASGKCPEEDLNNGNCCWKGTTAGSGCSSSWTGTSAEGEELSGTMTYGGCKRTNCQKKAAETSCYEYEISPIAKGNWRLPSKDELLEWKTQIEIDNGDENSLSRFLSNSGLNLCSHTAGYGMVACPQKTAVQSAGYSYEIQSGTSTRGGMYYVLDVAGYNNYLSTSSGSYYGRSARCVLGKPSYFSGGGGAAGSAIYNYSIPIFNTKKDETDKKYILRVKIGTKDAQTVGQSGINLNVYSKTSSGELEEYREGKTGCSNTYAPYKILIFSGSSAGKKADTATGVKGSYDSKYAGDIHGLNSSCVETYYYIGSRSQEQDGQIGTEYDTKPTSTIFGTNGGGSAYESFIKDEETKNYIGGIGGNDDDPNGQDGEWGAGGGGGAVKINSDGTVTLGKGGKGGEGIVVISYDIIKPPPVGGGGAGGDAVIAKGISVKENELLWVGAAGGPTGVSTFGMSFIQSKNDSSLNIYAFSGIYAPYRPLCNWRSEECYTRIVRKDNGVYIYKEPKVPYDGSIISKNGGTSVAREDSEYVILINRTIDDVKILRGESGKEGQETTSITRRAGGAGGKSGIGTAGGCGGHYSSGARIQVTDSLCYPNSATGNSKDGSDAIFNVPDNPTLNNLGNAGAGGGGGGWNADKSDDDVFGIGGKGGDGYVYIWWTKVE